MKTIHGFLKFALILPCILSCNIGEKVQQTKKPNIIFLLTDDQRWDALGANGNKIIQTPNLDKLANKGLNFRNAYVTTSICMVSRASILTGQYMSKHGINDFHQSLSSIAFSQTYPMLLKKHGYTIGFVGKFGVGDPQDQPEDLFDYWKGTPLHQPNYEVVDEAGDTIHYTDLIEKNTLQFLEKYSDSTFCLSVSFKSPHSQDNDPRQFIPKKKYSNLYSDIEIKEPETAASRYWDSLPEFFHKKENIARQRWKLRFSASAQYQESVKNYYRLITGVDDVVAKIVEELKKKGMEKNTIIIFMGDNGMYLGEHGLAGKWFEHEESIRVPLFIYDPRNFGSHGKIDKIALNIDIAPTILGYAGIDTPKDMQGVDLKKLVNGELKARDNFFYEYTFLGSPQLPKVEGVVSPSFKYMNYIEHNEEALYNLKNDPYEKNNLVNNPEFEELLKKERALYKELKQSAKN